jgi:two-component system KDP operon response regulator KdpE
MTMLSVLVADNDPGVRRLLNYGLGHLGYAVNTVPEGADALEAFLDNTTETPPDLLILETEFDAPPDGLTVCRMIRESFSLPIVFLSDKACKATRLAAFAAGGDDFVPKPFDMDELDARIQAILRRSGVENVRQKRACIQIRDLVIDLVGHSVTLDGTLVHLTRKEFGLLRQLAKARGQTVSNEVLLHEVWGEEYAGQDHYVRVYMNMLRKKLGSPYILTEPGVGYRLAEK